MIEQELLFLGLLKERPRHGYEIKRSIKEILSLFAGVDLKSIYYPLSILEKRELVFKKAGKQGRRPERFVYGLTDKGEGRFQELLNSSFFDFKRPQFSLDLSLYFLRYIKPDKVRRKLRGRIRILKKLSQGLRKMVDIYRNKKPSSLVFILEHNLKQVDAETQFLSGLIKTFK